MTDRTYCQDCGHLLGHHSRLRGEDVVGPLVGTTRWCKVCRRTCLVHVAPRDALGAPTEDTHPL